jgi:hypothetical protein
MVSIEQVRLLETKVAKAIDYVNRVTEENKLLKTRMDGYQRRIDELEILIQRFKEDQGRIEEGIVSALDRLNKFEDAVERTLTTDESPNQAPFDETPLDKALPPDDVSSDDGLDEADDLDAGDDTAAEDETPSDTSDDISADTSDESFTEIDPLGGEKTELDIF